MLLAQSIKGGSMHNAGAMKQGECEKYQKKTFPPSFRKKLIEMLPVFTEIALLLLLYRKFHLCSPEQSVCLETI